jgi:dethiobiotin synthetase
MTQGLIVAGTDTDVGKTVFAAGLAAALDGCYWKPVQCGLTPETDSETVRRLSGLPPERILPEAYCFATPASPHLAAERDGVEIDVERLTLPAAERTLIIEPAGGLMVPLTRRTLQIDVMARWKLPLILCASTRLGTINHTLLSIEALKVRAIAILGIAFIGVENADSERTIAEMSGVRRLGRLPLIDPLTPDALRTAFAASFQREDFLQGVTA